MDSNAAIICKLYSPAASSPLLPESRPVRVPGNDPIQKLRNWHPRQKAPAYWGEDGKPGEWLAWAFKAFEATYGYKFQGDNILIARMNLLASIEK